MKEETILQDVINTLKEIQKTQTEILVELAKKPCKRHHDRIKLLERVIFGLVAVILMAFMYEITGLKKLKTKASASPLVKEQKVNATHELSNSFRGR